mmetsp:Transcript_36997/g.54423  ORF Transcript_36997/g.54423 Transcript_36997/m.54423 type:complete len:170 (-) Transcript_36997:126-635(-)
MPAEKRVEESEDIHSDDDSCDFTFSSDSVNDCFEGSHENEANGDGAAGDGDGSISPSSDLRMMLPASASVKRVSLGDDDIEGSDDATTAAAAATTTAAAAAAPTAFPAMPVGMGNVIMPTPGGAFNPFGGFAAASGNVNPAAATTAEGDSSPAAAAPNAAPDVTEELHV